MHLLKFSAPPQITPPAGEKAFNNDSMGDISYSDHNTEKAL
jgi:hypothetical protein